MQIGANAVRYFYITRECMWKKGNKIFFNNNEQKLYPNRIVDTVSYAQSVHLFVEHVFPLDRCCLYLEFLSIMFSPPLFSMKNPVLLLYSSMPLSLLLIALNRPSACMWRKHEDGQLNSLNGMEYPLIPIFSSISCPLPEASLDILSEVTLRETTTSIACVRRKGQQYCCIFATYRAKLYFL